MLEGRLVRLRALEAGDLEREYRWVNDEEVIQYLSSIRYPLSRADEERWLSNRPANSFASGVTLAIETKDGAHIGNLGLQRSDPDDRKAELSIIIGEKSYWSRGYGADAIETLLRFAFHEMNLHRVWLSTLEYNERAVSCYRTCGFVEEARLRRDVFRHGRYWDFIVMGVLREEFETLHAGGDVAGGSM